MQVHQLKNKEPEHRSLNVGGDGDLKWYRCIKEGLEYAGYTLQKGDQINSSLPVCGQGVDLTKPHKVVLGKDANGKDIIKIHPPAFEEVVGMIPANTKNTFEREDSDPRSKSEIAEDIFLAFEEKVNPLRISRPDILLYEQKLIMERQKDGLTAVIDEKRM
jgi:hypothetical protein